MKNMLLRTLSTYATGEPDCALLPTVSTIFLFSFVPCFLPGTRYEKL